jgi:sarcosine oxidase
MEHDLPHEVLTGLELSERFPGYQLPHEMLALYQPDGGFLLPERSTVAFVNAAQALGAEIHGREQVLEWQPLGQGVRVVTDRAEYTADRLVVTAGSWDASLLPFLRGLAVPERQVLAWLQPEQPALFAPEVFPVFNVLVDEGRFYGFPVFGIPGFKFGKYHHFQEQGAPESLNREVTREDEELLREFAARYFPAGAGPTMTLKSCMFTNSPDNHFIIDLHPQYPQVSFAAGFSGHGYKFASVIGEILADLAERGDARYDIRLFSLARLTGQVSALHANQPGGRMGGLPAHLPGKAGMTGRPAGQLQRREPRRTVPHRGERPAAGWGRPSAGPYSEAWSYAEWDSTDPLYWERDSVEPFWL